MAVCPDGRPRWVLEIFNSVRDMRTLTSAASDCGGWGPAGRIRPDGAVAFVYRGSRGGGPNLEGPIELADGGWLIIAGASETARGGMTIVSDDGTVEFDQDFESSAASDVFVHNSFVLTPDGVFIGAVTDSTESAQEIVAIEIGIGRMPGWIGTGGNWARDNASWHGGTTR